MGLVPAVVPVGTGIDDAKVGPEEGATEAVEFGRPTEPADGVPWTAAA
jgi:hypothetical protein